MKHQNTVIYYGLHPHRLRAGCLRILRVGRLWSGLTVHPYREQYLAPYCFYCVYIE